MPGDKEYFIEYTTVGKSVKVTAIDAETGREVSIVGATSVARSQLAKLAVRKLRWLMKKKDGA